LPRRLISVFGTESSGSTFLATTIAIAAGAFPEEGGVNRTLPTDRYNNTGRTIVERVVAKRAMSPNGDIEVTHLSLPWGSLGKNVNCDVQFSRRTETVEALVPEPCFRFERESLWRHRLEVKAPSACRNEIHISEAEAKNGWSCGAKCGQGPSDGYALYPIRFFTNISGHIEWHLARSVDVTVVLSIRDQSISLEGKKNAHCKQHQIARAEQIRASVIMQQAIRKYGPSGRVVVVSYESLMMLKESYLYRIYETLGIDSKYSPDLTKDGNAKYVDAQ